MTRPGLRLALPLLVIAVACAFQAGRLDRELAEWRNEPRMAGAERMRVGCTIAGSASFAAAVALLVRGRRKPKGGDRE